MNHKNIGFLFPGDGSHYIGMGELFCKKFKTAAETFEEASDTLGFDLRNVCLKGSQELLTDIVYSQLAIFTHGVASFRVFAAYTGIKPLYGCGHGLGEYTALTCSGAFDFVETLNLVKRRAILIKKAGLQQGSSMVVIRNMGILTLKERMTSFNKNGEKIFPAIYNHENEQVIAGTWLDIASFIYSLRDVDAFITLLSENYATHCSFMMDACSELEQELAKCTINSLRWPVISNATATPYVYGDQLLSDLVQQLVRPVRWGECMEYIIRNGVDVFIEAGPKWILKDLLRIISPMTKCYAMDVVEDLEGLLKLFSVKNRAC